MSVFDQLVGQPDVVAALQSAAAGVGMAQAWLFTGPPGSGRSVAARAFAAALVCPDGGCGHCHECHTVLAGTHLDVDVVVPAGLSLGVAEARELVRRAAGSPVRAGWKVTIVEDADRLTEAADNALLKALEEPPPRGVWLLCAPSLEDVLPTIRSRCRALVLRTPPAEAVAEALRAEGVAPELAAFAARASGGHVGRARRLAGDEATRLRRRAVLDVVHRLRSVPEALAAAADLVDAAKEEAEQATAGAAVQENESLSAALGVTGKARPRGTAGAFRELEERQRSRATRAQRDALDRALSDLASLYRDVLAAQLAGDGPAPAPVNADAADTVRELAGAGGAALTLQRLEALLAARTALAGNVAPLLAIEVLMLSLCPAAPRPGA